MRRGLKAYGSWSATCQKAGQITAEDALSGASSCAFRLPQTPSNFQGQTKERFSSTEATRLVDAWFKGPFRPLGFPGDTATAKDLLEYVIDGPRNACAGAVQKELVRKTATRKLRLPGKLSDCSTTSAEGTEIFLVEGDSAGGCASGARRRETPSGCYAPWQDPQRRQRVRRQAQGQPGTGRSGVGARLRHARALQGRKTPL